MFERTVSLYYVIHDINRQEIIKNLFDRPIFFYLRSKGRQTFGQRAFALSAHLFIAS